MVVCVHVYLRSMHAPAQRKYPHQHRTHTPEQKTMRSPYTHTHKQKHSHSHTRTKNNALTTHTHKQKHSHSSTSMHAPGVVVRACACVSAQPAQKIHSPAPHTSGMHAPVAKQNTSQHKNTLTSTALTYLLLTPAPVSGSVCGGSGVCLWLAFLCGDIVYVCVNVSGNLFTG